MLYGLVLHLSLNMQGKFMFPAQLLQISSAHFVNQHEEGMFPATLRLTVD